MMQNPMMMQQAAAGQQPGMVQAQQLNPQMQAAQQAQDQAVFKRYDQDGDGFLSRPELLAYCKTELRCEPPPAFCDQIFGSLVVKGEAGLRLEQLPRLKMAIA